jgi:hypothetical protein
LGVGRLVKKSKITEQEAPIEALPPQIKTAEEATLDAVLDNFSDQMMEEITTQADEVVNVQLPTTKVEEIPIVAEVEMTQAPLPTENVEIPVIEEEEDTVEMSDVEIEFRALVTELMAAGVEPSDMMDDPRWEDISERAMATGFETWPVFLQLTAMQ